MANRPVRLRLGLMCGSLVAALAFSSLAAADEGDPPSRIARLAYIEGEVSFQPGGTDDWVTAPLNRPLTTGDRLWADRASRVELQLDGSLLRLSSLTSMSFLNLDDHVTQIQLSGGTLILNVRQLQSNETYEVDTPNLAFSILRPGVYRLSVAESGTVTTVSVRTGQGEVTGGGTAYAVYANETDVFSGTDQLTASSQNLEPTGDPFDEWSSHRDTPWERSIAAHYVSSDVVGYQDLDGHGDWNQTSDYGAVWFPRLSDSGWAPYHNGHWAYIAPWGYTWVDDEPWGFAPFHYGRWVSYRGAWGWVPAPPLRQGIVYVRPVYAPALVAWVGLGSGIGWFALGPREVYCPSYPVSRHYVYQINESNTAVNHVTINNIYNTTIINNRTVNLTNVAYANRSVPGAVAATTSRAFMSAQPVSRNLVKVDHREITNGRVQVFAPAVVPTRQAVLGSSQTARVRPPAAEQTRTVVARTPLSAPSVDRLQEAIRSDAGRPLSVAAATRAGLARQEPMRGSLSNERTRIQQPGRPQPVALARPPQQAATQQEMQRQRAVQQVQPPAPAQQEAQRQHVAQQQQQLQAQAEQESQRQQAAQRQQHQMEMRAQQETQRQHFALQRQQLETKARQEAQTQLAGQQMRARQEAQGQQAAQQQFQQIQRQQESQRQAAQQQPQARAQQEAQRPRVPPQQGDLRPGNRPILGQPR